jgi:Flp pilus assembly pilin Flp
MVVTRRSTRRSTDEQSRPSGQEGQGIVEYMLVLFFVAIALVGTLGVFQSGLDARYQAIASTVASL